MEKRDRYPSTVPIIGGSSGLRVCLASILSRRVRYPRPPPSLWLASVTVAQRPPNPLDGVQFPGGSPILSLIGLAAMPPCLERGNRRFESFMGDQFCPFSIMVIQWFCNPLMAVRFCHGAPSLGCEQQIQKFNF